MPEPTSADPPTPAEQVQMLFVRHEAVIRGFIGSLITQAADADDVLQETFLTVSRKAESFVPETNFLAWVCSIARLKVLEQHRRNQRAMDLSEAAMVALMDAAPTMEHLDQQAAALARCLEKLAPKARELVWRRYTGRQSSEMMAEALGMTSLAVRLALTKARAALRDCVISELKKLEA